MEYHPCLLRLLDDHKQAFFLAQVCKKRRTQPQGIPTSPREKAVFAHGFFQSLMAEHLFLEEEILFNYVRIHARGMEPLLLELTMEHQRMAELLASLKNSDQLADELEALGFFMEIHLRREETELFPIIQASLTSAQLDEVEQQFLHVLEPQQLESVDSGNRFDLILSSKTFSSIQNDPMDVCAHLCSDGGVISPNCLLI